MLGLPFSSAMHDQRSIRMLLLVSLMTATCVTVRSDTVAPRVTARMSRLPQITLWAWERPEDLEGIDPSRFAVAYLDQTLNIGAIVRAVPRRDPVIFPRRAVRIAVVRIQTHPPALLDATTREEAVGYLLRSGREPGIAALQVDFDATLSQRAWYRALLVELRRRMPARLPLSMTALASWCSYDDWLRGLPVDEAVPMFFEMEPDRRRAPADFAAFRMREPLCEGSIGLAARGSWPSGIADKRIYLFPENGWRKDLTAQLKRRLP